MDVIRKDATITNVDDAFPGTFRVVLSAPTKDRDGETLLASEWKQPLPDHITFDVDHEMSVKGTVGSGRPSIDEQGRLIVDGTYSSLPRAQETRTLVKEGHINRTSVAFMTEKTRKDGVTTVTRELLNGAFVAIPANREAVVLSAKAAVKAGARNSRTDSEHIQAIHDHALALGAVPHTGTGDDAAAKAATVKDTDTENAADPGSLAAAADAAVDAAIDALAGVDPEGLPAEVLQAFALIQAADAALDELLDALGVADPDEDATDAAAGISTAAAAKAAAAVETTSAAEGTDSTEIQTRAARLRLFSLLSER